MVRASFRTLRGRLKKYCPTRLPIRIYFLKGFRKATGHLAECQEVGKTFIIRIDADLSSDEKLDCLIHEWAHAMTPELDDEAEWHGDLWGRAYARCYQVTIEKLKPDYPFND